MDYRKILVICWLLFSLGLLALIGYLCFLFKTWWPVLLVLALPGIHSEHREDDKTDDNEKADE